MAIIIIVIPFIIIIITIITRRTGYEPYPSILLHPPLRALYTSSVAFRSASFS